MQRSAEIAQNQPNTRNRKTNRRRWRYYYFLYYAVFSLEFQFQSVRDVLEIQIRLLTGMDLNRISVLFVLSYAKWQGAKTFHGFLHGEVDHSGMEVLPPMTIKGGAQRICDELVDQSLKIENLILNQPVQSVSYMEEESRGTFSKLESTLAITQTELQLMCNKVIVPKEIVGNKLRFPYESCW